MTHASAGELMGAIEKPTTLSPPSAIRTWFMIAKRPTVAVVDSSLSTELKDHDSPLSVDSDVKVISLWHQVNVMNERPVFTASGFLVIALVLLWVPLAGGILYGFPEPWIIVPVIFSSMFMFLSLSGLFAVAPNESKVLQLFGRYVGTTHDAGLRWANPFYTKRAVSLRTRIFESSKLKVNDSDGNPIEIGAVIVWHVSDTAKAVFSVDDYVDFVRVQSESALRDLASSYPYDAHQEGQLSLRASAEQVAHHLAKEVQRRVEKAGLVIDDARLTHLAYSAEVATAMLQRQQASAIVAARQKIVEGAVGMVEMALDMLSQKRVVNLDEEHKATMVSNLLVVLCGERSTQPVINTGTIYR
jgi:SPFH domain / Band 7 family